MVYRRPNRQQGLDRSGDRCSPPFPPTTRLPLPRHDRGYCARGRNEENKNETKREGGLRSKRATSPKLLRTYSEGREWSLFCCCCWHCCSSSCSMMIGSWQTDCPARGSLCANATPSERRPTKEGSRDIISEGHLTSLFSLLPPCFHPGIRFSIYTYT